MTTAHDHPEGEHNHPLQIFTLDHECSTVVFAPIEPGPPLSEGEQAVAKALGMSTAPYAVFMDLDYLCRVLTDMARDAANAAVTPEEIGAAAMAKDLAARMVGVKHYHLHSIDAQESAKAVNTPNDILGFQ